MGKGGAHGSVVQSNDGQGNSLVYVHNNGGDENISVGHTESAVNQSGGELQEGDVALLAWDSENSQIVITAKGVRATGDVPAEGTTINITNGGDSDLQGEVTISTTHGNNDGYGGASGVRCANVGGKAAYLSAE